MAIYSIKTGLSSFLMKYPFIYRVSGRMNIEMRLLDRANTFMMVAYENDYQ